MKDGVATESAGVPAPGWAHDDLLHAWWVVPGEILAGEYPWGFRRGDEHDEEHRVKLELLADAGIDTIFDFTIEGERPAYEWRWEEIGTERSRPVRRLHYPIADGGILDPELFDAVIAEIDRELASKRKVYLHCFGGRGRTGTVAAIWHVSKGSSADEALALVRAARKGTRKEDQECPETDCQYDAIRDAERRRGQRQTRGMM